MDKDTHKRLIALAYERLEATRDDDEEFSFLFRTPGARCVGAFLKEDLETFAPHLVNIDRLDVPWSDERKLEIQEFAEPTAEETEEWRAAVTRHWRAEATLPRCIWRHILWLTPIVEGSSIEAIAVFSVLGDGEGSPSLLGLYDDEQSAEEALTRLCIARG